MTDKPDRDASSRVPLDARPPGMPRWLKLSALVVVALVVLLVLVMLLVGGDHGPGRHLSAAHTAEWARLLGSTT